MLGAMLVNNNAIDLVAETVKTDDFYRDANRLTYDALLTLHYRGEEADIVTTSAQLERDGSLQRVGGREFIHSLAQFVPTAANVGHYARIVKECSLRRMVIRAGQEMIEAGFENTAEDALETAEAAVYALGGDRKGDDTPQLRELLLDATARIDDVRHGRRSLGVTTHLDGLNDLITGIAPGSFNILAARPAVGKTCLACDLLRHLSRNARCLLFSVEMSKDEIVDRLLAAQASVGLTRIRSGEVAPDDIDRIGAAVTEMGMWRLSIDDTVSTMWDIHRRTRKLAAHGEIGLVVIDYIQLLTMGRGRPESRQQEVAAISRQLKLMAREFKVPVLALSQLSRPDVKYERERGKPMKPTLASLRESGALEQDADLVMFLWRPNEQDATNVELLVAKNRSGPTGKVPLLFVPHMVKFLGATEREA